MFPPLEGEDPRAVTALYDRMLARVFKAGHAGAVFGTIGALDMALWDLKAKMAGEPLWRTLGARDRFVPGYASGLDIALDDEELVAPLPALRRARAAARRSSRAASTSRRDMRRLDARARRAATQRGPRPALMLDVNESLEPQAGGAPRRRIERTFDLTWIEEPVRRWDADGLAAVGRGVRAAVATGENLTGLEQYRPLLDADAVDVVQAGSVWGITHFLRVAALAHGHDLPVSPVGYNANPLAHAAAAVPNHLVIEVQDLGAPARPHRRPGVTDGGIVLGDAPRARSPTVDGGGARAAGTAPTSGGGPTTAALTSGSADAGDGGASAGCRDRRPWLHLPRLGFGASGLGDLGTDEATALVDEALDRGFTYFDTSPYYGSGRSEELLGAALRGRRDEVVVATKCGRYGYRAFDHSPSRVRRSLAESLERLGLDHVDLYQLHDIEFSSRSEVDDGLAELVAIRDEGLVRGRRHRLPPPIARRADGRRTARRRAQLLPRPRPRPRHPRAGTRRRGGRHRRDQRFTAVHEPAHRRWPSRQASSKRTDPRRPRPLRPRGPPSAAPRFRSFALQYSLWLPGVTSTLIGATSSSQLDNALDRGCHAARRGAHGRTRRPRHRHSGWHDVHPSHEHQGAAP